MAGINNFFEYSELVVSNQEGASFINGNRDWPVFSFTSWKPNLAGFKILSVEIPDVFDIVSVNANTLIYTASGVPNVITVSSGAPSGATLASQLQTAISAISPGFTVTYNTTTFKFTFTQNLAITWSISFTNKYSLYRPLGFTIGSFGATGIGSTVVSPNFSELNGPPFLNLNSNTLGPYIHIDSLDGYPTSKVARFAHGNNARGANVLYNATATDSFLDFIGTDISKFDLYLTMGPDEVEVPLDVKGLCWSVKIGLYSYRDGAEKNPDVPKIGKTIFK